MYVLFESIFHLKNIYLFITSRQINSAQFGLVINIYISLGAPEQLQSGRSNEGPRQKFWIESICQGIQ